MNTQVQSLVDQMLSIANTTLNGQYVFSGTQTSVPPFTLAHGADTWIGSVADANGDQPDGGPRDGPDLRHQADGIEHDLGGTLRVRRRARHPPDFKDSPKGPTTRWTTRTGR